ncbi:MAG: RsmE family RNA methyltransferase [Bacteroidota bacterium]
MNRFYNENVREGTHVLSEEESRHCSLILRHQEGDEIVILDGKGGIHKSLLTQINKRSCKYEILESNYAEKKDFEVHLVIAPTKNIDRIEWLIEKLEETGIDKITFIETQNSERRKLRLERLEKKAISAMKQSGSPFLIEINNLTNFNSAVSTINDCIKLIANVNTSNTHISQHLKPNENTTILIGPEGDFSDDELRIAKGLGFIPTSLGNNTLRTETAGLMACSFINFINRF